MEPLSAIHVHFFVTHAPVVGHSRGTDLKFAAASERWRSRDAPEGLSLTPREIAFRNIAGMQRALQPLRSGCVNNSISRVCTPGRLQRTRDALRPTPGLFLVDQPYGLARESQQEQRISGGVPSSRVGINGAQWSSDPLGSIRELSARDPDPTPIRVQDDHDLATHFGTHSFARN
jgi:hypothetical protein